MGLAGLDAALAGLRISQQQLSVISNNIANVGTPGYSRKILPQASHAVNGQTVGVNPGTIIRRVDLNLERNLWTQISSVSALDIQTTYLQRLQQFHGPPDKELSIAAEIARLQDSFASLTDNPSDAFLQTSAINEAEAAAQKFNDLAALINTSRNDVQGEMRTVIGRINDLLEQIADLNNEVKGATNVGRTTAIQEDKRDDAIKELSSLIEINFFKRGDGVLVLQTTDSVELVSNTAKTLYFDPQPVSANTFYPDSVAAVYVGDPAAPGSVDITAQSPGGKLGGLLELRDSIFPKQNAQLDELAHKMALRFDVQGLRLFTDRDGNIPSDTAPDPTIPTPVEYVGFATNMRVNQLILDDHTLLQTGTYGASIPTGSNEIPRRILQFSFGNINYQQAIGDIDLNVSGLAPPNNTLQNFLGINSTNTVTGTRNLSSFTSPASFIAAANGALAVGSDTFRMTFQDTNIPIAPVNIDVALNLVPDGGGNFVQDLIAYITGTVIPALPGASQTALTDMDVTFSESPNGQLSVTSNAQITTDATGVANGMGEDSFALLGFNEDTYEATDPYFDVIVGNHEAVRITIDSDDDETDLLAKLNAVTGLAVEDLTLSADGFLRIRPGNNYSDPDFGGDIRIVAGAFQTSSAGANAVLGPGTIPDGLNIVSALFGSFSAGPPQQDLSPITNVEYGSETDGSLPTPPTQAFRTHYLGPGADISTNIPGSLRLVDFAQRMVDEQSQHAITNKGRMEDQDTLRDLLEKQLLDDSAVNLDEELGNLVVIQTAYAAAARVISAVNELFNELLSAVVR